MELNVSFQRDDEREVQRGSGDAQGGEKITRGEKRN